MEWMLLEDFHHRKLWPSEPLSAYLHYLKKLLGWAIPGLEKSALGQLLLHQFLPGLPDTISWQLRVIWETKKVETAVEWVWLVMTIEDHGHAATISAEQQALGELVLQQEQVAALMEWVSNTIMPTN